CREAVEDERAVLLARRRGDLLARGVAQYHRDPGQTELALLHLPGDTATGLEVAPHDAGDGALLRRGLDGLLRAGRHRARRDRRRLEDRLVVVRAHELRAVGVVEAAGHGLDRRIDDPDREEEERGREERGRDGVTPPLAGFLDDVRLDLGRERRYALSHLTSR